MTTYRLGYPATITDDILESYALDAQSDVDQQFAKLGY